VLPVEEDLWTLTSGRPQIDPERLARAVERQALADGLDFRTRLLIRDSIAALAARWDKVRLSEWLSRSPAAGRLTEIANSDLGEAGFPSLGARIMAATKPEVVLQFLRELGTHLPRPARVYVGGSASLIIAGLLSRQTEDVDLVDEVPPALREQHELLDRLSGRYGLRLAHVQSRYLPSGWEGRARSLGVMGQLEVHLLDPPDVFLSKLFSSREKDRDDLRELARELDRQEIASRLRRDAAALYAEDKLRQAASSNWYIVYGEALPQ
jgi:hypothetical protein